MLIFNHYIYGNKVSEKLNQRHWEAEIQLKLIYTIMIVLQEMRQEYTDGKAEVSILSNFFWFTVNENKIALTSTRISHIAFKITKRIAGSSVLYVSISTLQDEMIGKFVNVKLQYKVYSRMSVCGTNP